MANNFLHLLRKDTQMKMSVLLFLVVLGALIFLIKVDASQEKLILQLQAQKDLVGQIPDMEKQQAVGPVTIDSLSGIIFNEGTEPVAVINNNIVRVGDFVGSHNKVVLIKHNSVVLNDGEKEIELTLAE